MAILDFLNQHQSAFLVGFTAVVASATVIYARLTAILVATQTEPQVVVSLVPHTFLFGFVDLQIKNEGHGPAREVRFETDAQTGADPELVQTLSSLGFINRGLDYMSAGQEVRTFFASMIERNQQRMNTKIAVVATYSTASRRRKTARFVLDFSPYWNYSQLGTHPLVSIASELKEIRTEVAKLARAREH